MPRLYFLRSIIVASWSIFAMPDFRRSFTISFALVSIWRSKK